METCHMRKGPLIKVINQISLPGVEKFFFQSGAINAQSGNHLFVSAKTDLRFITGFIEAWRFHHCIKLFKSDYFDIGVTSKELIFKPYKNNKICLFYFPKPENFPEINLWDSKIEWQRCPSDLFEGINQVGASSGQEVYEKIYVSGQYVIGKTGSMVCRYRLDFLSPFEMTFEWDLIKKILNRFKELKLLRATKYTLKDAEKLNRGIAFDFDDLRIWVSEVDCPGPGEEGYRPKPDLNNFHSRFLRPAQFLVELPTGVRNELKLPMSYIDFAAGNQDSLALMKIVAVKKGKGNLEIDWDYGAITGTTTIPVSVCGPLKSVSFIFNFTNFFCAVKDKGLMGHIAYSEDLKPKDMIYLKEGRRETLIGVGLDYKQKKGGFKNEG